MQSRVEELTKLISICDEEIRETREELELKQRDFNDYLLESEERHLKTLLEKEAEYTEEFDADKGLTDVFQQRAHDTCIQSVLNQQDTVLQPEFVQYREGLLELAAKELETLSWAMKSQHARELMELASHEEESFEKRVKRVVHSHEENLRRLS